MRRISDKGGRVTLRELYAQSEKMSTATGRTFKIDTMLGGSRVAEMVGGGLRNVSPRMSKGALMAWIDAWWAGFNTALATLEGRGVNLKIFLQAKGELCPKCGSADVAKQGEKPGSIGWTCAACGYLFETFTG